MNDQKQVTLKLSGKMKEIDTNENLRGYESNEAMRERQADDYFENLYTVNSKTIIILKHRPQGFKNYTIEYFKIDNDEEVKEFNFKLKAYMLFGYDTKVNTL
jgi:hypothetical protein